jgi:transposase-like protein
MAQGKNTTGLTELLLKCMAEPDPMLSMLEESKESYSQLFQGLQHRGLETPLLVVSDANKGLIAGIRKSFPGASWQRCKVHFMRNVLAHVTQKEKETFAAQLRGIWLAPLS